MSFDDMTIFEVYVIFHSDDLCWYIICMFVCGFIGDV